MQNKSTDQQQTFDYLYDIFPHYSNTFQAIAIPACALTITGIITKLTYQKFKDENLEAFNHPYAPIEPARVIETINFFILPLGSIFCGALTGVSLLESVKYFSYDYN